MLDFFSRFIMQWFISDIDNVMSSWYCAIFVMFDNLMYRITRTSIYRLLEFLPLSLLAYGIFICEIWGPYIWIIEVLFCIWQRGFVVFFPASHCIMRVYVGIIWFCMSLVSDNAPELSKNSIVLTFWKILCSPSQNLVTNSSDPILSTHTLFVIPF